MSWNHAVCTAPHPPRAALAHFTTLDATLQRRKGPPSHESCYPKAGDSEVGWSRADDAGGPGAQWWVRVVRKVRCWYKMASGWSDDVGVGGSSCFFSLKVLGTLYGTAQESKELQALLGESVGLGIRTSQRFSKIIQSCAFWTYS